MKKIRIVAFLLLVSLCVWGQHGSVFARLRGVVYDYAKNPVTGVELRIAGSDSIYYNNIKGYYDFRCNKGDTVYFHQEGFDPVQHVVNHYNEEKNFHLKREGFLPLNERKIRLTGRVYETDADGKKDFMPGIVLESVLENQHKAPSKKTYASTDIDGAYSLDCYMGEKIVINYIGIKGLEWTVSDSIQNFTVRKINYPPKKEPDLSHMIKKEKQLYHRMKAGYDIMPLVDEFVAAGRE